MPKTPFPAAGETVSATSPQTQPITRRAALAGIAAAPAASLPTIALSAPHTQKEISQRVLALAAEISHLLDNLDGGNWHMRVSPTFRGEPNVHMEPGRPSPISGSRRR